MTEDEMVGWNHRVNGHELGQTLGDGEGQGGLACCSPWGHKESERTGQLNKQLLMYIHIWTEHEIESQSSSSQIVNEENVFAKQ